MKFTEEYIKSEEFNQKDLFTHIAQNTKEQQILILNKLDALYKIKCLEIRKIKGSDTANLHTLFSNGLLDNTAYKGTENDVMDEFLNQKAAKENLQDKELQNLYSIRKYFKYDEFEQYCTKNKIQKNELDYFKQVEIRKESFRDKILSVIKIKK
ncbi:hypothetical protein RX914_11045 [Pseudomonas syringae pv. actinidiae]|nr:hypothetical protein [Pseudomonas syringae pv. actinidiae]MDU8258041.1 hypothetical protein [Pseudomonas syringae pv. actinidiae]MDU8261168.1 hypothetical protein [Pseudomonas syringae pv. actinidiae]MDU8295505.1 hypothetical protein [Pseudomonas syringae pv. actinidiae]MDU8311475.1 hypothetical protein [Pseudomonas syringae pv. actinidiae]